MAIAGKVAITLKGDWDSTATYEKLDAVSYNNGLYIAKKASTGVTPVNGDTWMLSVQSVDAIEFEKIIDGTTVVGKATNANTADTLNAETADLENIKTTFTEATTRETINSKETLGTLFGKIKKWFADLKTVAFTGSYNDLSNRPSIPSVGNGTITINQGGATKGSFSMNQSGDATVNLTDSNTWRPVQNNLTSDSTTDCLAAAQGKILKGQIDELNNNLNAFPVRELLWSSSNDSQWEENSGKTIDLKGYTRFICKTSKNFYLFGDAFTDTSIYDNDLIVALSGSSLLWDDINSEWRTCISACVFGVYTENNWCWMHKSYDREVEVGLSHKLNIVELWGIQM